MYLRNKFIYLCIEFLHRDVWQTRRYSRVADTIRYAWKFGQDFSSAEVKRVLGILAVNSFCVHDGVEEGTGLVNY